MGIRSLSTSSVKTGVRRNRMWDQTVSFGSDFYQIATTTVGSGGSSTVTFSSIPQDYTHLQLRITARSSTSAVADPVQMSFNGNSFNDANYGSHFLRGDGATPVSAANANMRVFVIPAATATASIFGVGVIDILDYTNTNKFKTVRTIGGHDRNGSGQLQIGSNLWRSTNAITQISFQTEDIGTGATFVQYSRFDLYGIKA